MGLENDVLEFITNRVDELMCLQREMDIESSPRKRTDYAIAIEDKFDELIVQLKYWGNDINTVDDKIKKEEKQKALKEFGFPEKVL